MTIRTVDNACHMHNLNLVIRVSESKKKQAPRVLYVACTMYTMHFGSPLDPGSIKGRIIGIAGSRSGGTVVRCLNVVLFFFFFFFFVFFLISFPGCFPMRNVLINSAHA